MGHTFANNLYHIIFSTKDRVGLLEERHRQEMHQYICGTARSLDGVILTVNSMPDHVHLVAAIKPSQAVSDFVGKIKANASRWLKERFEFPTGFQWQSGFSCFTISPSTLDRVKEYIAGQQEHHKTVNFADELKAFLDRHGIAYDPACYLD